MEDPAIPRSQTTPDFKNKIKKNLHENCFACGPNNEGGLRLHFDGKGDGFVSGYFVADEKFEGYSGIVHGGILATLLDSAMAHCLFKKGILALTGRLSIRYSFPVRIGRLVKLEARIVKRSHKIFFLEAEAFVEGKKTAHAEGRYMSPEKMNSKGA